ncbi:MAG: precorrin-3B synthase [Gordonia sp. (in: high G+C Gram-positive bacteria)]
MSTRDDRCPGVFRTHQAADGRLARVRLPGGRISSEQLEALAAAADEFGDGFLELTVRGNLQVRGIGDDAVAAFASLLVDAGLAGDAEHDRVRNISVSPLSGRVGSIADLWPLAESLDDALRARSWTSELSGRFWFGLDDGHGDVLARRPDLGVVAVDADRLELVVAGAPTGRVVVRDEAPAALLAVAEEFLRRRDGHWNIASLDGEAYAAVRAAASSLGEPLGSSPDRAHVRTPLVGWFGQDDGRVMLGAVTEFARLSSRQAQFLAAIGAPVLVTADREILIADLTDAVADTVVRVLAPMGFVFDVNSPWVRVSACTGSPGCDKSHADVRGDLRAALAAGLDPTTREHWTGCDRGCGSPAGEHVRVQAQASSDVEPGGPGYRRCSVP